MARSRLPTGAWLDEHLAGCSACRAIATAYETDRLALRALRDRQPEPPRDLWARTSAALERESAGRGHATRGSGADRRWPAFGVLSGVAVVAVVVGANLLSGGFGPRQPTTADLPTGSTPPVALASNPASPDATPIAVGAGDVEWIGTSSNGALAYNVTDVDEVCPVENKPGCAPVADRESKPVAMTIRPKSISRSPVRNRGSRGRHRPRRRGQRHGDRPAGG